MRTSPTSYIKIGLDYVNDTCKKDLNLHYLIDILECQRHLRQAAYQRNSCTSIKKSATSYIYGGLGFAIDICEKLQNLRTTITIESKKRHGVCLSNTGKAYYK